MKQGRMWTCLSKDTHTTPAATHNRSTMPTMEAGTCNTRRVQWFTAHLGHTPRRATELRIGARRRSLRAGCAHGLAMDLAAAASRNQLFPHIHPRSISSHFFSQSLQPATFFYQFVQHPQLYDPIMEESAAEMLRWVAKILDPVFVSTLCIIIGEIVMILGHFLIFTEANNRTLLRKRGAQATFVKTSMRLRHILF